MVYVPFLNIEFPEPKLALLIPDIVDTVIQGTSKVIEHARDALDPPGPSGVAEVQANFEALIPREFDRVRKRAADGKIVNSDQLSSELEDAGYDYYRRLIRTSVRGATDEGTEEFTAKNLGLLVPSALGAVQQQYVEERAAAEGVDLTSVIQHALLERQLAEQEDKHRAELAQRSMRIQKLRKDVRPLGRHIVTTVTSASGGMVVGVFLFKSAMQLARKVFGKRSPKGKVPPAQRRTPPKPSPRLPDATTQQAAPTSGTSRPAQAAATSKQATPASDTSSNVKKRPPPKRR